VALNKARGLLGVVPDFDYAKPGDFQNPVKEKPYLSVAEK